MGSNPNTIHTSNVWGKDKARKRNGGFAEVGKNGKTQKRVNNKYVKKMCY